MSSERILMIFDMDGVLVDTLPMLEAVYNKFLEKYGYAGNREEFSKLNGYTIREIAEYLKSIYGLKPDVSELLSAYQNLIAGSMHKAALSRGTEETLEFLRKHGCTVGVASSAGRLYIDTMLKSHGVDVYFDFIVSGDDVKKAKPSTEIYERAAGMCDFERCYIVEDSDNGLKAAQIGDSRCRSVFYQGTQVFSGIPYAYRINDLRQLKEIVLRPQELRAFVPYESLEFKVTPDAGKPDGKCEIERLISGVYQDIPGGACRDTEQIGAPYQECIGDIEQEADRVWQAELARKPGLFNGGVMFFSGLKEAGSSQAAVLQMLKSEYKYYKWAMYRRDCGSAVPVLSMAVSGILLDTEGNTLLARRGNVTQYESLYELVPSGGLNAGLVDALDIGDVVNKQILEELEQELAGSVSREDIGEIRILGISCDIPDQVLDICVLIRLNKSLKSLQLCSNEEYEEQSLRVVKLDSLLGEKALCERMVPTSIEIVKHLKGRI